MACYILKQHKIYKFFSSFLCIVDTDLLLPTAWQLYLG